MWCNKWRAFALGAFYFSQTRTSKTHQLSFALNQSPRHAQPSVLLMRFLLGFTRTLVALSMGVWIGGLAFFGAITAAIMFPMTREAGVPELAPQMVGPMLSRFALVCAVCSLVLVLGWALDGAIAGRGKGWMAQGVLTLAAVGLGTYLNFVLLPQTERDQKAVLPLYARSVAGKNTLSPREAGLKARFDAGHQGFNRLAGINIYLLIGALACLMARTLPAKEPGKGERADSQSQGEALLVK